MLKEKVNKMHEEKIKFECGVKLQGTVERLRERRK